MSASIPDDTRGKRGGRKRDSSRDRAILEAVVHNLADVGYDRMTMDMVAETAHAGKGTVYRRWSSKSAMVLDAVSQMKEDQVDLDGLPDTGSLRGDLLALFQPMSAEETGRKLRVIAALASLLTQEAALAKAAGEAIAAPWTAAHHALMLRAVTRGEIAADAPIVTLATVIPSLGTHRVLVQRQPFDGAFLVEMVDHVLLPALGLRPGASMR